MVLLRIRDEIDGTLAFRSSCRSAVCGSCAMVINGKIDLACRTQAASFGSNTIILEPLPNMQIIKDLVVDMTPFWDMYEKVKPYMIRKGDYPDKEIAQTKEDRKDKTNMSTAFSAHAATEHALCSREPRLHGALLLLPSSNASCLIHGMNGRIISFKMLTARMVYGAVTLY